MEKKLIGQEQSMLITFSGLDGAGKTTQIELLAKYFNVQGRKSRVLRMYEDISISGWFRGRLMKKRSSEGSNKPSSPYRHDKNRKDASLVRSRKVAYVADLLSFCLRILFHVGIRREVLILDRYLYDALANLYGTDSDAYMRFMLRIVPRPDKAIFLDVEPHVAFGRKPEYPPEYYGERREAYLKVFERVPTALVVPTGSIEETHSKIVRSLW